MPRRTLIGGAVVLTSLLMASCGSDNAGGDIAGGDIAGDSTSAAAENADAGTAVDADPIAGVDLASAPEAPARVPDGAAVHADGLTTVLDGQTLGIGQCDITDDRIAVRIGQSGPSWQPDDDSPQHEGLAIAAEIAVDGSTATFRGEVVITHDPIDFDSWERTVGSVTVSCAG